jgi:hypothetical protein
MTSDHHDHDEPGRPGATRGVSGHHEAGPHGPAAAAAPRPSVRLVTGAPSAPAVVHLSPSLIRMGAAGRAAIAGVLAVLVWAAVLSVIG